MMKDQNSDSRRKGAIRKGQRGGIPLHDGVPATPLDGTQPIAKASVIFETGHAGSAPPKFAGGSARSGSNLQHVITQRPTGNNPREHTSLGDVPPKGRGTKPVL